MLEPQQVEEIILLVSVMDRSTLIDKLVNFHGGFPLDFTEEFLADLPLDRLRHIFVALCLQASCTPEEIPTAA